MTYASAPYWWVVCDAPDCNVKSTEGSDYAAWAEQSGAWDDASDNYWARNEADTKHYCDEHRWFICSECEKSEGREYPKEHDGMCDECWAEDS
jgi:hypothetical protein